MQKDKQYDLEDRTLAFAKTVRVLVKALPRSVSNHENSRQVVRASGSVGANYIEANEAFSRKDLLLRIKICRKEAKETRYWWQIVDVGNDARLEKDRDGLIREAAELMNIFGSIIRKTE
jgi:four helix bundle protein